MDLTLIGCIWIFVLSHLFHLLKNHLSQPQRSFNLFLFQKKVNNKPVKASHNVSSASVLMVHLKKATVSRGEVNK